MTVTLCSAVCNHIPAPLTILTLAWKENKRQSINNKKTYSHGVDEVVKIKPTKEKLQVINLVYTEEGREFTFWDSEKDKMHTSPKEGWLCRNNKLFNVV